MAGDATGLCILARISVCLSHISKLPAHAALIVIAPILYILPAIHNYTIPYTSNFKYILIKAYRQLTL